MGEFTFTDQIVIQAFSGSGLVSVIASKHLVTELGLHEVGYLDSDLMPSLAIVDGGYVRYPVQVYANSEYLLILNHGSIPQKRLKQFIRELYTWYDSIGVKSIRILGGLPTGRDHTVLTTKVEVVCSDEVTRGELKFLGVEPMESGYVFGSIATSLLEAQGRKTPAIAILSDCIPSIPDFVAAQEVIKMFSRVEGLSIDLGYLQLRSNELRDKLISENYDDYDEDPDRFSGFR